MSKLKKWLRSAVHSIKNSFQLYKRHDTATLGAALSYYTVFSLAPLLLIVVSVSGALLGPEAVQGEVKRQLQSIIGSHSADLVQDILKAAYKPGSNLLFTIIAIVLLIVGATSVFGQLRTSLNTIWDVKPRARKPIATFFLSRLFSVAMIISLAFLLLISLMLHAGLAAFTNFLERRYDHGPVILLQILDFLLSGMLTVILFTLIYRFMSDVRLKWRSVIWGAVFTTVLFMLGKYIIGIYLTKSNLGDTYGAAGSIVLLLVWVFYSSQILFFGAEFTRSLAIEAGVKLHPTDIKPDSEVGIHNKHVDAEKK
ncbi:MAG: YihY/virulence factor BrkB family protein [Chitinophagales bacterium]